MSIYFSNYVRQGKKTFKFGALNGGVYGSGISYKYGYFNGNKFEGLSFSYDKHTEVERDDDERDGIGSMTTVLKTSFWLGSFVDGEKNGYCTVMDGTSDKQAVSGYFDMGRAVTEEEAAALSLENKQLAVEEYTFEDWQTMPVDPIDEDGFSVLREMDYFSDGDLRYTVTEGSFKDGKLHGLGTEYYDSNVNGYHIFKEKSGVFKDGVFFFGYNGAFENRGGNQSLNYFGYADGRDIDAYGEEIVYEGKRYIGEAVNGVPSGIGCLFEGEDKMLKGTFKDGKLHGIGCTYKLVDGKWFPFDFKQKVVIKQLLDENDYPNDSWGIFVNGKYQPDMTWEKFFDAYSDVKKV